MAHARRNRLIKMHNNVCRSCWKPLIFRWNHQFIQQINSNITAHTPRWSCKHYLDPGPTLVATPTWLKLLNTGGPLFWETPNDELLFFTSGKEATVGKLGVCVTDRRGLFRKLLNSISFAFCRFLSPSTWRKETNELEFILDKIRQGSYLWWLKYTVYKRN